MAINLSIIVNVSLMDEVKQIYLTVLQNYWAKLFTGGFFINNANCFKNHH